MAEKSLGKHCMGSLPELHVPYYKTFQVHFLTQICDKTQTYVCSCYRKKNLCRTQICVQHRVCISGSPPLSRHGESTVVPQPQRPKKIIFLFRV